MKFSFAFLLALIPTLAHAAEPASSWKLVWSDEFDYKGLPNPEKWDYEEGFVRNDEAQYYTRGRLENARVEDGCLVIEARKEKFANARYRPDATRGGAAREFAQFTSASVITRRKAEWQFGRIEVRAKIPSGQGVWPAVWMLGSERGRINWPACGEIDIMEFVGHTPNLVHATVHFQKDGKHASAGSKRKVDKPFDDFHIYAVEWTADQMEFYFDKQKYFTFKVEKADDNSQNPFRKPQYLLLNLAMGGSWGGKIDDAIASSKYLIDYVRVYQQEPAKQ